VPYQVLIRIDGSHLCPWIFDRRDNKIAAQKFRPLAQIPFVESRPFSGRCLAASDLKGAKARRWAQQTVGISCPEILDHVTDAGCAHFILPAPAPAPAPYINTVRFLRKSVLRNTPRPLATILRLAHLLSLRYEPLHLISLQHGQQ
jgi:hypothetical protein